MVDPGWFEKQQLYGRPNDKGSNIPQWWLVFSYTNKIQWFQYWHDGRNTFFSKTPQSSFHGFGKVTTVYNILSLKLILLYTDKAKKINLYL